MDFLKTITGKVVGGMVTLVVLTAGISWWRMDESTKDILLRNTGRIVSWFGIMLLAPWVTFFVISWVATKFSRSNLGGVACWYSVYTALEAALARLPLPLSRCPLGTTAWTFFAVGTLLAAGYNLLIVRLDRGKDGVPLICLTCNGVARGSSKSETRNSKKAQILKTKVRIQYVVVSSFQPLNFELLSDFEFRI